MMRLGLLPNGMESEAKTDAQRLPLDEGVLDEGPELLLCDAKEDWKRLVRNWPRSKRKESQLSRGRSYY